MKKTKILFNTIMILIFCTLAFMACPADAPIITPPPPVGPLGPDAVVLGTAENYVILAKTGISTVPASAITGEIGLSPAAASFITGFTLTHATGYATSAQVTGRLYAADMANPTPANLTAAIGYMGAAYTDAAGRTTPDFIDLDVGNIGGLTLLPGLYLWSSNVTVPINITISGKSTDTWIFQITGNLDVSSSVQVILQGGALAKNIVWQVAGAVTLEASSHFEGVILCETAVTMNANASLNGRIFSQTAVSLNQNTIVQPAE